MTRGEDLNVDPCALVPQPHKTSWPVRLRHRLMRREITVPAAAVCIVIALVIAHFGHGPASTITTAPSRPALVVIRQAESDSPPGPARQSWLQTRDQPESTPASTSESTFSTPPAPAPTSSLAPAPPRCRTIVHLGDSNLGMSAALFHAAYDLLGIRSRIDYANGRGATFSSTGQGTTALQAIADARAAVPATGRCWVIALGSEDAVDAVRRRVDAGPSIRSIADALDGEPALWVTPILTSTETAWNFEASTRYNASLVSVLASYPNIGLVDWQSTAVKHLDQFEEDGVHYHPPLYKLLVSTVLGQILQGWELQP